MYPHLALIGWRDTEGNKFPFTTIVCMDIKESEGVYEIRNRSVEKNEWGCQIGHVFIKPKEIGKYPLLFALE